MGGRGKEYTPAAAFDNNKEALAWDGFEKESPISNTLNENFQNLLLKVQFK